MLLKNRIVAIHQPNFFPWLGFFDKLVRSDIFILLDNVQFPQTGSGVWTNRVKVVLSGKPAWITVPIARKFQDSKLIKDVKIDNSSDWRSKMARSLEYSYKKAVCYQEVWDVIHDLIFWPTDNLCDMNCNAILEISRMLGIDETKIVKASDIPAEGKGTDLLISLTRQSGGSSYLCGNGAGGYQEDSSFASSDLQLIYQEFRHPVYKQMHKDFIEGLSIIDALFCTGREQTKEMLGI